MSETNQARKLKFGVLASIYTYYGYIIIIIIIIIIIFIRS